MKKFTTLVATDFSKSSYIVLEKALEFTKKMNGELHVVHVVENSLFSKKIDLDSIKESGFAKLGGDFPNLKKENFHCVNGKIKIEVANTARVLNADIIIIGKSGETYLLSDLLMGSHTKEIVRNADTPVLVMKSDHELKYENILVLTDLSENSAKAIKHVTSLFANSKIKLINFFYLPFENRLNAYGFNENDFLEYQASIKEDSQKNLDMFVESLELPKNINISASVRRSTLNPKLFKEEVSDINYDLLAIHTTGRVSFYAFDILEESGVDVFIAKVD